MGLRTESRFGTHEGRLGVRTRGWARPLATLHGGGGRLVATSANAPGCPDAPHARGYGHQVGGTAFTDGSRRWAVCRRTTHAR